jgi:hypothetical protein
LLPVVLCATVGCPPPNPAGSGEGSEGTGLANTTTGSPSTTTPSTGAADSTARHPGSGIDRLAQQPDSSADEVSVPAAETDGTSASETEPSGSAAAVPRGEMAAIDIELPAPAFRGTPKPENVPNVEPALGKPRPPFFAPVGTVNVALGRPVICSDPVPDAGEVDLVTDGDKEASDFGHLSMRPGTQWVQIDLEEQAAVYAVLVWHNHADARVYFDVIVQIGDDPDMLDAKTVFNNDLDNSSGMGIGSQLGYVETNEGKLIDCRGTPGRYVRLYSRGNHFDDNRNHYTEVEVYGKPLE